MKRFVCSDIIPGCAEVFTGDDDQSVLDQVIAHAASDHGLVKPPLALIELVVATTHAYCAPRKDRHLRLVPQAASASTDQADQARDLAPVVDAVPGVSPDRDAQSEPVVVSLPTRTIGRQDNAAAAHSPVQETKDWATHPLYRHECLLYGSDEEFLASV
ncbi:MAG: DUF1059 domain-containing protein, partial [Nakamurella sp.]